MNWLKKYFYFFPVLLYLPALWNFFSGDDWFHLRISQISSLQEFFNFFSFTANAQTASFYRPLSTQVFFFVFQKLFGLTAWPYYLFGLALFAYSIYLVRKFSSKFFDSDICNLTSLIYALSVSNFTRVYFLSAYQELFLVVFSLLTLISFAKKPLLSIIFFVLALLSKETAIVLPVLITLFYHEDIGKNKFLNLRFYLPSIITIICISVIYAYFRLFHFGLAVGDSYVWNFSPQKIANTFMWYLLWSFGAPELLVDYVGTGLRLVPKFFTDYQNWWKIILFPLIGTILVTIALGITKLKKINSQIIIYKSFFVIALLPVLFLPSHKFTLELGLPLVGFSLIIGWLLPKKFNILSFCFFAFFIFLNLSMNYLTYTRHYSVSRSEISKKVYSYFYPRSIKYPVGFYFEFINDTVDNGVEWGQSKQISQSLSGSDFFKVFYNNPLAEVYYEDYSNSRPEDKKVIPISTALFIK